MYKQAIWDVTSKCNLRCRHCYAATKYDNAEALSSDLTIEEAKKTLKNLKDMGFINVLLLGGEPLARKDIFEILEYATSLGLNIMINTNGTFLSKEVSSRILNYNVSQISISFQGTTPEIHDCVAGKGSFQRTLSGIENFMDERAKANSEILTGIQFTITKPNLHDAANFLNFALDCGVNGFSVNFVDNNGRMRENEDLLTTPEEYIDALELIFDSVSNNKREIDPNFLIQTAGKQILIEYLSGKYNFNITTNPTGYKCPAGTNIILVQNDGTVTPCGVANNPLYYTSDFYDKYQIENINVLNHASTHSLYHTEFFERFLRFKYKKNAVCANCAYSKNCQICPLQFDSEIKLCQAAQQRYDEWRSKEETKKLNLQFSQELYATADSAFAKRILDCMTQNQSIIEIADAIAQETHEPIENVKNDLWEFYNDIKIFR